MQVRLAVRLPTLVSTYLRYSPSRTGALPRVTSASDSAADLARLQVQVPAHQTPQLGLSVGESS